MLTLKHLKSVCASNCETRVAWRSCLRGKLHSGVGHTTACRVTREWKRHFDSDRLTTDPSVSRHDQLLSDSQSVREPPHSHRLSVLKFPSGGRPSQNEDTVTNYGCKSAVLLHSCEKIIWNSLTVIIITTTTLSQMTILWENEFNCE